jgi:hypothetical protein
MVKKINGWTPFKPDNKGMAAKRYYAWRRPEGKSGFFSIVEIEDATNWGYVGGYISLLWAYQRKPHGIIGGLKLKEVYAATKKRLETL